MHMGNIHAVNNFHRLGIGVGPSNHESPFEYLRIIVVLIRGGEGLFQGVHDGDFGGGFGPGEEGDDDVMTLRERTADGLVGHPAHDDGAAGGLLPEVFHVARQVPQQGVLAADGMVVGDRDDKALFHMIKRRRGL